MSKKNPISGWLNLNKPLNITSAKAVAIVKHKLHPYKVGHAGTLDPLASGVLPLALGEATKTIQFCMDSDKEYEFTIKWGESTDTFDSGGKVTAISDVRPTQKQLLNVLPNFIGKISQVPPVYSAIKIGGKRSYDLARNGIHVEMKARDINIYNLEIINLHYKQEQKRLFTVGVDQCVSSATFRVSCGKGTYVRSLAMDISSAVGALGHISSLIRTKVGKFSLKDSILLEDIEKTVYKDALSEVVLSVDTVLDDIQVLEVTPEAAIKLRHGQKILIKNLNWFDKHFSGIFVAKCEKKLVAICEVATDLIKPVRVFNLN